jgi:cation-transporting ATPase 13A1
VGKVDLSAPFSPNILNSCVFILSSCMQVSTFAINYKGHPFMQSLSENKALRNSLMIAGGFTLLLASEIMPDLNETFQLTPFPSDEV